MTQPPFDTAGAKAIAQMIKANGAIDIARFMGLALGHPQFGYYMTRDPLGRGGDFTTAPEISQMFGELIGIWCADQWMKMGSPAKIRLVELGPGRGTLMADLLRATKSMPGFHAALTLHMVETSPALRQKQAQALEGYAPQWHDSFAEIPLDRPFLIVANEFFDALPIRQLVAHDGTWHERVVGLDDAGEFIFGIAPAPVSLALEPQENEVFEFSPVRSAYMGALATALEMCGGSMVVIDYGHEKTACGDTLQAIRDHHFSPVLHYVGEADITSHVDFDELARIGRARNLNATLTTQAAFLEEYGVNIRAQKLKQANPAHGEALDIAIERLTGEKQMGRLFKALVVTRA